MILTTANKFGGKNFTLSYLYIAFAVVSFLVAILFGIKSIFMQDKVPSFKA